MLFPTKSSRPTVGTKNLISKGYWGFLLLGNKVAVQWSYTLQSNAKINNACKCTYNSTHTPSLSCDCLRTKQFYLYHMCRYVCLCILYLFYYYSSLTLNSVDRVAKSVQRLATGWTVRGSNPDGGGVRISAPVQTGPGKHLASCTMFTGFFPRVNSGWGVKLSPHPLLVLWSWKSRAIPLHPCRPYGLYGASVPVQGWPLLSTLKICFFSESVTKNKCLQW
jgi:hypothetical protein